MHLLKSLRPFAVVLIDLALANPVGDAEAAVITLDGIKDSSDPAYATIKSVLWFNDHQGTQFCSGCDPLQTTDVQYGTGTLAGGDSTEYFFVYMEAPLAAKNLVWGDGISDAEIALYNQQFDTHHTPLSNVLGDHDYFDFGKAVGSEKFVFNGITANPRGNKDGFDGDDVSGAGLINAVSSFAYVLNNNLCDVDGCDLVDWIMSFEFQFDTSAAAGLIAFFDEPNSEINTHLSPERGGLLAQPEPNEDPVPAPGTLALLCLGLLSLGLARSRLRVRRQI